MACIDYEDEDSTAYDRRRVIASTTIYYIKAVEDAASLVRLLDVQQPYGKRGKKGKSNKDWDK